MVYEKVAEGTTFRFYPVDKIIEVASPTTEVSVQTLINVIRDFEDEHLELDKIADATGKDFLGGGLYTAITLTLRAWKLRFEARTSPTECRVYGGNLLATDASGNYVNPIAPSANVTVTVAQSSAATLLGVEQIEYKLDKLERDLKKHDSKMTALTLVG